MALVAVLQGEGNKSSLNNAELVYHVFDDAGAVVDLDVAREWFLLNAPATFDALIKEDGDLDEVAPGIWEGTVKYGLIGEQEAGADFEWNFEIGTQSAVILQSKATIASYVELDDEDAPVREVVNYKQAINVTREGVQGQEIPKPVTSFNEVHYLDSTAMTNSYQALLQYSVGKVNSVSFRGRAAGEVFLAGISGSGRGRDAVQLNFRFDVSENATGLTVGPITGIAKKGWELLWVTYEEEEDADAGVTRKTPVQVNVERTFDTIDFATVLGI